jgi:hypothetical protein
MKHKIREYFATPDFIGFLYHNLGFLYNRDVLIQFYYLQRLTNILSSIYYLFNESINGSDYVASNNKLQKIQTVSVVDYLILINVRQLPVTTIPTLRYFGTETRNL